MQKCRLKLSRLCLSASQGALAVVEQSSAAAIFSNGGMSAHRDQISRLMAP
ncbi:hypothetical protein IE4872_PC00102 (plasmid) [Rhizobium gallicum]|uniref:Uncharacterized protein n=2 Tax=Rhizobium gallicum TaxID=56730 RepID=A0A0B4X6E1_9HYPH|nr:hypothetical protein RGR602_PB00115 [Rhizobium gallicum bv. gallicum R602sp]APO70133.1 hypothetical protein IE4872_PC00102 [Rhizobium gallicum]